MKCKVSVIMPVYNGAMYLAEAIISILNQTFTNFEFIIINDGSTDNSDKIIKSFDDKRIRYISFEKNQGVVAARNHAISIANGKYIAFHDSDDIALSNRLSSQVKFLNNNVDYGLIGSCINSIDENGEITGKFMRFPTDPKEIQVIMLFSNCFITSSVIVRKSCLTNQLFNPEFFVAEDYDLWIRISDRYKVTNLQEVLVLYRVHNKGISTIHHNAMLMAEKKQLSYQLSKMSEAFNQEEFNFYFTIGKIRSYPDYEKKFMEYDIITITNNLMKLINANDRSGKLDKSFLLEYLFKYWLWVFSEIKKYDLKLFRIIKNSAFYNKLGILEKIKFIAKCSYGYNIPIKN